MEELYQPGTCTGWFVKKLQWRRTGRLEILHPKPLELFQQNDAPAVRIAIG